MKHAAWALGVIQWGRGILSAARSWAAVAGAVALLLVGTNAVTYLRTDAAAYARGARDQQIIMIGKTAALNARLDAARDEAARAALDAEDRRRELTKLERVLADERARDPLADGQCISPDGLLRIFRVP